MPTAFKLPAIGLIAIALFDGVLADSLFAQCASDLDGSGQVDGADIGIVLGSWGPCSAECDADLNRDALVDGADLARVLSDWGLGLGEDRDADGIPDECDDLVEVATTIFDLDFEDHQVGLYTESMLEEDWNDPSWSNGIDVGRVSIVATDDRSNLALAVLYPEGEFGTSATGAQWKLDLDGSFEHVQGLVSPPVSRTISTLSVVESSQG